MKLPSVYPLTRPSSHKTSRITAIVKSIVPSCYGLSTRRAAPKRLSRRQNCVTSVPMCGARFHDRGIALLASLAMRTTTSSFALTLAATLLLMSNNASDFATTAHAQAPPATDAIDPALLAGLSWRSIGPARGGRSQAVAGSSSRPLEYYFGATGGGLWKTTDGGVTWRAVSDKFFQSSSVGAVAVSESNPDVVYIVMGETELRGNIIQGDGVYKSTDGGKTFAHVGLEKSLAIARIRVHPNNLDIVFVAALGDPYGANPERGVFKSTDGGQ